MNELSPEQQRIVDSYRPWIGGVAVDALPEFICDRISPPNCAFGRAGEWPQPNSAY